MLKTFPLRGVIGIVANAASELDIAVSKQLQCVEVRGDLLLHGGLALDDVLRVVERAQELNLACLFTLRHPSHGGKFGDTEQQRILINRQALAAGADLIDLEWGTKAAEQLLSEDVDLILSHHDFEGMIDEPELTMLTQAMSKAKPKAIKIVPTATTPADAARILRWVADADDDIVRIGFAMGAAGACSRVLTVAFGAPITYASFGRPVAPGQVAMDDLLELYR